MFFEDGVSNGLYNLFDHEVSVGSFDFVGEDDFFFAIDFDGEGGSGIGS